MTKILPFPEDSSRIVPAGKNDTRRPRATYPLSVVAATLASGEGLPLLVNRETWVPMSLATRWVVLSRRYECAESTLRTDLNGLRYLYVWGNARFPEGIDARLEAAPLAYVDLIDLRDFLLDPKANDSVRELREDAVEGARVVEALASAGGRALAAKAFLTWAISPANRNQRGAEPVDARERIAQLESVLSPLANRAGAGGLGDALDEAIATRIDHLLAPLADDAGRFLLPLRWCDDNPFQQGTRLRNWLMWSLARDCGLRLGELLSLRLTDFPLVRGQQCLTVIRRPDAKEDERKRRPAVKTKERALPMGPHSTFALSAYTKERPPLGRRRGSVYLFSAWSGKALSISAASLVTARLTEALGIHVHWHAVRHAWATDIARGVLRAHLVGREPVVAEAEAAKALLTEQLRELGGWSEQSSMPWQYARQAIKEYADAHLRVRQEERVCRILSYRDHGVDNERR